MSKPRHELKQIGRPSKYIMFLRRSRIRRAMKSEKALNEMMAGIVGKENIKRVK